MRNAKYELYEISIEYDDKKERIYKMLTLDEYLNKRGEFNDKLCFGTIKSFTTKLIPINVWKDMVAEQIFNNISIEDFCKMILRLSEEV